MWSNPGRSRSFLFLHSIVEKNIFLSIRQKRKQRNSEISKKHLSAITSTSWSFWSRWRKVPWYSSLLSDLCLECVVFFLSKSSPCLSVLLFVSITVAGLAGKAAKAQSKQLRKSCAFQIPPSAAQVCSKIAKTNRPKTGLITQIATSLSLRLGESLTCFVAGVERRGTALLVRSSEHSSAFQLPNQHHRCDNSFHEQHGRIGKTKCYLLTQCGHCCFHTTELSNLLVLAGVRQGV